MTEAAANSIKLTQAQIQLEAANKKISDAYARMDELWAEASQKAQESYEEYGLLYYASVYLTQEYYDLQNTLVDLNDEIYTTERTITNPEKAIGEDADAVVAAETEINAAREAIEQLTGVTEEMTEAEVEAARQTAELNGVIGDTMEELTALAAAYEEAYGAALESISMTFGIRLPLWLQQEPILSIRRWEARFPTGRTTTPICRLWVRGPAILRA